MSPSLLYTFHPEDTFGIFLRNAFNSFIECVAKSWSCRIKGIGIEMDGNKINPLTPNDPYMGRTAPLTSKRCILYIYSTNICTEYFKHALYFPFFFSSKCSLFHNAKLFGFCIIHILYTGCAKIKKNNSGSKGLSTGWPTGTWHL